MEEAKLNDTVRVHYRVSLEDGSIFDSTGEKEPFEFTIGKGMVISGFEKGIIGMKKGETKIFSVSPSEAYGEYDENLVFSIERDYIPPHIKPEVGMVLRVHSPYGFSSLVTVKEIDDETVILDANHPLAGKTLIFEVRLVEILK
ncbi:MAG: peptidylprolyl isomerase [Desulfobacterota bacterium]|nr:peptidylprolyl isomerase [Thermodesulfobacteriota bacterium]MDW8001754.1 peptidylprolyl isomerase [Deltaproteobacteria bacterium]